MTTKQVIYLPILSSILFSNNEFDSISARELKILSNNFHCPIIYGIYERGRNIKIRGIRETKKKTRLVDR